MAGSAALTGAAVPTSADVVQITLTDQITTTNTGVERSTITGDFTEDGVIDMTNAVGNYYPAQEYVNFFINSAKVASAGSASNQMFATVNGVRNSAPTSSTARWFVTQGGLIPITIRDGRINNGAATAAFIDVLSVAAVQAAKIQILRTVFDDESTGAPAGVVAGGANPEFVPGRAAAEAARRIAYTTEIKKLKKKIKKVKGSSKKKAKKLKKKLKKVSKLLAAL